MWPTLSELCGIFVDEAIRRRVLPASSSPVRQASNHADEGINVVNDRQADGIQAGYRHIKRSDHTPAAWA